MTTVAPSRNARAQSYLLFAVVLSVLTTLGIRFTPEADAAQSVAREEVDGVIFELFDDDTIHITLKSAGVTYRDNAAAAPANATKNQLDAKLSAVQTAIREDFGWDMAQAADRARAEDEIGALGQALDSISNSDYEVEEYAALRLLRNLVHQLQPVTECRGRCLQEQVPNAITAAAVGGLMSQLYAEFANPELPEGIFRVQSIATAAFSGTMTYAFLQIVPHLTGIRSEKLRIAAVATALGVVTLLEEYIKENRDVANARSVTPKQDAAKEAADIADLTPSEDNGRDYDMVKDEL